MNPNLPLQIFDTYIEIGSHFIPVQLLSSGQWVLDHDQYEKFLNDNREFFTLEREDHKKIATIFNKATFKLIEYLTTEGVIAQGTLMIDPGLEEMDVKE